MSIHGKPPPDTECMCSFEEINESNFVEYQTAPSETWHPAKFSEPIVREMLETSFQRYLDDVEKAARDCAAAVRRLVSKGPPIWLEDKHAFPLPDEDTHVVRVWFCSTNTEESARLKGALDGADRDALWDSQKEVLAMMEAAEASTKAEEEKA
mmetsp:Transcript_6901/g.24197  ORF Transcript_6901/g.24197 Transcript_6901/m.24197 type:complete len:153 (-) Transcript_6901:92-550(-)